MINLDSLTDISRAVPQVIIQDIFERSHLKEMGLAFARGILGDSRRFGCRRTGRRTSTHSSMYGTDMPQTLTAAMPEPHRVAALTRATGSFPVEVRDLIWFQVRQLLLLTRRAAAQRCLVAIRPQEILRITRQLDCGRVARTHWMRPVGNRDL